eukprot:1161902-Rhodomonas_salina.1
MSGTPQKRSIPPPTTRTGHRVVQACLLPMFTYGSALVDWSDCELQRITAMWASGRRLAWKLAPGAPHALHLL